MFGSSLRFTRYVSITIYLMTKFNQYLYFIKFHIHLSEINSHARSSFAYFTDSRALYQYTPLYIAFRKHLWVLEILFTTLTYFFATLKNLWLSVPAAAVTSPRCTAHRGSTEIATWEDNCPKSIRERRVCRVAAGCDWGIPNERSFCWNPSHPDGSSERWTIIASRFPAARELSFRWSLAPFVLAASVRCSEHRKYLTNRKVWIESDF